MSYALNNKELTANFADSVLSCPNSKSLTVQVSNGACYYQIALGRVGAASFIGSEAWEAETFLGPGYWNFDETDFYGGVCHGVRFRYASATQSPQTLVTASA